MGAPSVTNIVDVLVQHEGAFWLRMLDLVRDVSFTVWKNDNGVHNSNARAANLDDLMVIGRVHFDIIVYLVRELHRRGYSPENGKETWMHTNGRRYNLLMVMEQEWSLGQPIPEAWKMK